MKRKLTYIIFEVTRACNLNCRFCYNIWKRPGGANAPRGSYRQAIRTLKRLFSVADVRHVTMTGGEPFLFDRFAEVVLFCRMKRKRVSVISNGNAAARNDYEALIDLGVDLFEFPLHSANPGTHDAMTGAAGSWRKSLRSIMDVMSLGGEVVAVLVVTKFNAGEIEETLSFIENLGVKRVMLNRFNIGGAGILNSQDLFIGKEDLRKAYGTANEIAGRHNIEITSNVCTPVCILNPEDFTDIKMSACYPAVLERPLTLDISGNLRFCNHSPVVMGNIFGEKLDDILSSEYLEGWRNIVPDYCSGCDLYARCFGGCRAASEQLGLSLHHPDPILHCITG